MTTPPPNSTSKMLAKTKKQKESLHCSRRIDTAIATALKCDEDAGALPWQVKKD